MKTGLCGLLVPLFLISCKGPERDIDVQGTLVGKHYSNPALGFSLDLPAEWDTVAGDRYYSDPGWNAVLDSSIKDRRSIPYKFTHLLTLARENADDDLYCAIGIIVEDMDVVGSAREYFEYTQRLVSHDPARYPKWEFSDIQPQTTIGGKEFLTQAIFVWTAPDEKKHRVTYCREIEDKLLVVTITDFYYKEALAKARELLTTVKWHDAN
jgi:hypothetical protein